MIPDTKWVTLVKLSSPMLQEPSMTNTRSDLAPLQTEEPSEKPEEELKSEFETFRLRLWGRSPAQAGGMVGGGLGVGGSVGTGVGFTTTTKAKT